MIDFPLALSAGLISTVNPCGFAMLPAYLSYMIGLDDEDNAARGRAAVLGRALAIGAVVSAGFLAVFGVAGILLTIGVTAIVDAVPWVALAIGAGLVVLGVALLSGYSLGVRLPTMPSRKGRSFSAVFAFGVSYALASLSCTLPIFLTLVTGSATNGTVVSGIATFLVYAAGMALVLMGITVGLALGKDSMVRGLRRASRFVNPVSGVLLVLAGAFIVFYWTLVLSAGDAALVENPVARAVEELSGDLQGLIGENPWLWSAVFALPVAAAATLVWRARRRRLAEDEAAGSQEPAPLST